MTKKTNDALEILDRLTGDDPAVQAMLSEERTNLEVARLVYNARKEAGLTQRQLAERVGTSQSAIARLEDADYQGHSVTMLKRIAAALERRLELRFVPIRAA